MKVKVEMIRHSNMESFQKMINEFLGTIEFEYFIDIRYSLIKDERSNTDRYTALIMYRGV